MDKPLKNKTIVIVGGTSGLGLSAAEFCFRAGANVVIVGRDEAKGLEAAARLGNHGRVITGDATDPETADRAVELAAAEFGRLDGMYHVAGGSGRRWGDGPLDQLSDEGWTYTLRMNLDGLFHSNRAAVRQFLRQESGGTILNMSSVLANSPAPRYFATHAYATSKAAVIGLTRAAAAYYAPQNIRFNAICPALVDTPMAQRAVGDEEIMRYIHTKQPLDGGRVGRAQDLNEAVLFFLSDASRFVTGQVLAVDGGWSVSEGRV